MKISLSVVLVLAGSTHVYAQFAPPGAGSGGSTAVQLPLSGRTGPAGSVVTNSVPVPGQTASVNTLNTSVQVQGSYLGSVKGDAVAGGKLSFRGAIDRGLQYNLGTSSFDNTLRQIRGQSRVVRSALMPNINAYLRETVTQTNLRAFGLRLPFAPSVVGPFNYFDLRANLSQAIADLTALENYRASKDSVRAAELFAKDARGVVVLAVGAAYFQVVAARARIVSARAQLETSEALFKQTSDQRKVGVVAQIDVNRSQVELQVQQQRLSSLENDLAKQKIILARLIGLPAAADFDVADDPPYSAPPPVTFEQALTTALQNRYDLRGAEAQIQAAERARAAVRAERLPSLALAADYGVIGVNPAQSHGTFTVAGTLRIPLWQGGRISGEMEQAEATLSQRKAELEDLRGRIEADIRNAMLDLEAASSQIKLAENNRAVVAETLRLTQQKFDLGVTDIVDLVRSRESVASAELDYITSMFAHNVAKLSLARALGKADEEWPKYIVVP